MTSNFGPYLGIILLILFGAMLFYLGYKEEKRMEQKKKNSPKIITTFTKIER